MSVTADSITVIALSGGRNEFYNYTPDGNRTQVSILAVTMESTFYRYYSDSDLIKVAGNTAYHYDENGNLLEKGNVWTESGDTVSITATGEYWKYEYDLLNRLTKVYQYNADSAAVELVVEYGYDVNNLRVYRKTSAGEITHFVFDLDGNRIEEHASTGSDYYVWRNGRHLARRTSDGITYFYSTDHVGSTVLMTDEAGAVVWSGEATPFGDQVSEDGALADSEELKYQGKDYDPLTSLVYMNARWYSPELGRFMSKDPARDGVNWFAFVGNNPLTFVDPTGLADIEADRINGDEFRDTDGDLRSPTYLNERLAEVMDSFVGGVYTLGGEKPSTDMDGGEGIDCSSAPLIAAERISGVGLRDRTADEIANDPDLVLPGKEEIGSMNAFDWKAGIDWSDSIDGPKFIGNGKIDHLTMNAPEAIEIHPSSVSGTITQRNQGALDKLAGSVKNIVFNWRYILGE